MARQSSHQNKPRGRGEVTAETPLTALEQKFVEEYIKTGLVTQSAKNAGYSDRSDNAYKLIGHKLLKQPNIQAEIQRTINAIQGSTVATAKEVMEYFTAVMRGEIADQFGLEAPLGERTIAARELAKRTIDIENRQMGNSDVAVEIKLNWERGA